VADERKTIPRSPGYRLILPKRILPFGLSIGSPARSIMAEFLDAAPTRQEEAGHDFGTQRQSFCNIPAPGNANAGALRRVAHSSTGIGATATISDDSENLHMHLHNAR
jgi:hypothetical protein